MEEAESKLEYFFDTYAIIEILGQNPSYEKYKEEIATISIFNLAEIYRSALGNFDDKELDEIYNKYKKAVVDIDDETIKEAMKFKVKNKGKRLSYADCIGYIYSKRNKMKFLTGDREFKDLEGVEFVKYSERHK